MLLISNLPNKTHVDNSQSRTSYCKLFRLLIRALEQREQVIITLRFGLQVYEFTVIARDGGKVSLEGHAKVSVTLIDVNDNYPVFEPTKYQVGEHAPLKTPLTHLYLHRT